LLKPFNGALEALEKRRVRTSGGGGGMGGGGKKRLDILQAKKGQALKKKDTKRARLTKGGRENEGIRDLESDVLGKMRENVSTELLAGLQEGGDRRQGIA